jgi:tRNA(Leu) C34 or U34 (ribose-2'-O)-methylase TrmL
MLQLHRNTARGYACVGLYHPKTPHNVGSVLRAAGNFSVSMVALTGARYRKASTDTMQQYRNRPLLQVEDLRAIIPYDCVPVAVDLVEGAENLVNYKHPERAFYIFGPEDSTLGEKVLSWCRDKVYVPTKSCMNLAGCVHVVLYDRMMKEASPL